MKSAIVVVLEMNQALNKFVSFSTFLFFIIASFDESLCYFEPCISNVCCLSVPGGFLQTQNRNLNSIDTVADFNWRINIYITSCQYRICFDRKWTCTPRAIWIRLHIIFFFITLAHSLQIDLNFSNFSLSFSIKMIVKIKFAIAWLTNEINFKLKQKAHTAIKFAYGRAITPFLLCWQNKRTASHSH